ncbi:amino acid adenylation domain-containing protein [Ketobacter sp. MCCC 1A13808]|uniref:non-ribosomal peptide synthetase n=1 Tax=Ketobacter sp. MCCC 1A13808 TaxID=2602738 RepID=UPI0012EBFD96|nr:non-ribosomal peptide synthetase [Ketobacter sp. MCCC 1A13808]MVF12550.1 amino acid adenylation domain-containing protein [Ketobacter sp. MCCC 1A13808]
MSLEVGLNSFDPATCSSLVELLEKRAAEQPDKVVYTFLPDGDDQGITVTYQELQQRARANACRFAQSAQAGSRALLLFPSGLEFIYAFFGCLYAGIIAVPAYPPRRNQNLGRLKSIIRDSDPAIVLVTSKVLKTAQPLFAESEELSGLPFVTVDLDDDESENDWQCPQIDRDSLAFLQYTSGSTGNPKGVMVSHGNLIYNESMITSGFSSTRDEIAVSWLPLFHDMGLIGTTLQPLYLGASAVFMSPASFLQKPFRWLKAVSDYKGNVICAPNFAYELCVSQITEAQRAELDLSSLRMALSGAEAVRADTIERFIEAFGPQGFTRGAFNPTYGLAEATLLVTSSLEGQRPRYSRVEAEAFSENRIVLAQDNSNAKTMNLVSNGVAPLESEVVIVDPETKTEISSGKVGEIWAKGENIAKGYWRNEAATQETFAGFTKEGKGPYLKTGDLGCLIDGELYITGRQKDVIIIRGRNHYPQDIELSVQTSHVALKSDAGAAFAVEIDGEERLVVVQEVERKYRMRLVTEVVSAAIRQAVAENHELQVHTIVYLKPGAILKTSSGKIQHSANKAAFLDDTLDPIAVSSMQAVERGEDEKKELEDALNLSKEAWLQLPEAEKEPRLVLYLKAAIASEIGEKLERISDNISLMGLGIDSLQITQLFTRLRDRFEIDLDLASLFDAENFRALGAMLADAMMGQSGSSLPPLEVVERQQLMPMSFSQKRMWFMDKLRENNAAYNLPFALKIQGAFDIEAGEKAFESMINRHEVLRTIYIEQDGHAYQSILPDQTWRFTREDLTYLKEPALSKAVQDRIDTEASKPFSLATGPVIRTHLLQLPDLESDAIKGRAAEQYVLLVTMHHIAADGFSLKVITDEISFAYAGLVSDSAPLLPELPIQYADFSQWQKDLFDSGSMSKQLEYWTDHLRNVPVLDLPLDHPRPPEQSFRGSNYYFQIPKEKVSALKQLSRTQGVTFYMTLLASFKVLLHHYTQSEDICVGTPIANRTTPELEKLIGFFVNTLALRSDLTGNPAFVELLQRIRKVTQGAFTNQELPFERVVEGLGISRDLSYSPVFQVMFVLQNSTIDEEFNLSGVNVESLHTAPGTAKFDMTLEFSEESGVLHGDLEYSTDLFEEATIIRFVDHLRQLMDSIIAQPQTPIGSLSILTAPEQQKLLQTFNATDETFTASHCIHSLFEQRAQQVATDIALVDGSIRLDYDALNQRSNQLAHYLISLGVKPETLVGVCMERQADLIVALLAILKTGAAYVPIDPNYPADRVAYMLADASAPVVISQSSLAAMLPVADADFQVVNLDQMESVLAGQSKLNPALEVAGEQLAYVIYTSGSTGKPKGVMITHSNAAALIHWGHSVYSKEDLTGVLAATSVCFDLSVFEIFVTLAAGGKIILAENVLALPELPARDEVVLVNTVPSAIDTLLRGRQIPRTVKVINLAGEALAASLVDGLYQHTQVDRVYDLYGPSEDTTYSTFTLRKQGEPATIGRPIANTRAYVLNQHGCLVPPGLAGELYLSGTGVTKGYRNLDAMTAEKFLNNPFEQEAKYARMYRTGDLVRYQANGNLEYLGRIDHQVKVRGFRIELGEIQSVISAVSGVRESLVLTRADAAGSQSLVAYMVNDADQNLEESVLITAVKAAIRSSLPDYMVPAAFVVMDSFPLTPNGKIDRKALPAPSIDDLMGESFVEPRTDAEREMGQIWCEVLKLERVGVTSNFFELGGHSLLATQCISRIRDHFRVDLPIKSLFTHPTIEELCSLVNDADELSSLAPPPVQRIDRAGELPLSFAQMRLWFLNQLETGNSEYNISTSYNMPASIRLTGKLNTNALRKAYQAVVDRHEALRTSFLIDDGKATQVIRDPGDWFMDVRDLRHLDAEEREAEVIRLAEDEATRSFDLVLGSLDKARRIRLMRTRLLQTDEEEFVLLLTMHHIISDGWSLGILIEETGEFYRSMVSGDAPRLEPIDIQYADYAAWQRQWMDGPVFEHQISYWRDRLQGVQVLELPTDRPRPAVMTFKGNYEPVRINPALTKKLNALSRDQGVTQFMTLLTSFYTLLYRYTGQTDICIGTPVANRARPEFEKLIGCFVNSLALRADLENDPRFVDLLMQVQDTTLSAYNHQDLPFERLVDALGVARDKSHSPLFQVMFTLQNASSLLDVSMPGVAFEMLPSVAKTAKFDLTLNLEEGPSGLEGMIEYNTDLFDRETVHRMVNHLEQILEKVAEHPHLRLSEIPLLSDYENQLVVKEWNHQPDQYEFDEAITVRFERIAEQYAAKVALKAGDESLTYSELNQRANRLAAYLVEQGVQTNQLIGINLNRSAEMVVSILAVLKAGAAYVPLDPTNPRERNEFILQDAKVALLITESGLSDLDLPGFCKPLIVDQLQDELLTFCGDNVDRVVGGDHRAYVIYTSGTTGKPKGVLIPHSNVIRLFTATDQWFGFSDQDVWTLFHSFAFDFSVWELWGGLLYGGKVIIVPSQVAKSTEDFYQLVCDEAVTVLNQTPSAFTQFIRIDEYAREKADSQSAQLKLRYVVFGGEALDFAALQQWNQVHGLQQPQLINMYGITETTVHVTYHRITEIDLSRRQSLIGRPIPDLDLYILDKHMNPVPIGVPGELYVGGQGLSHGYLHRPELTSERFTNNPFGNNVERQSGLYERLYKTGDLGRYLANGVVEYLGRIDDQVKIRGYRIELGEIESTISLHPQIRESVVLAREDVPGDKRLVGYLLKDGEVDLTELKGFLGKSLPDYMVPKAYVLLDAFPLTANGKVDKKALPEPDDSLHARNQFVAPRNDTEEALTQIWKEVLNLDQIGVTDNFFDLGGHSLLATQVVSRVRDHFNVDLPLSALFEEPTIENIALHLLQAELSSADDLEMADLLAEIEGLSEEDLKNL